MIVKIILGYLIIRFALVVANLIVQLAKAYSPPRPPAPRTPPMDAQVLAEGQPAEAAPPEESPALPESTSNT